MPTPYTLENLKTDLQVFLISVKHTNWYYYTFFNNFILTGLRFNEVRQFERWEVLGSDTVKVTTEKKSIPRIINIDNLDATFVESIYTGEEIYYGINHSTATTYFKKYYPTKHIYNGNKQITTHLFRYHYAKNLFDTGSTREEIRVLMGEVAISNSNGYIDAELYY